MTERKQLMIFWAILAILLAGGLVLSSKVGSLAVVDLGVSDVTTLLATFFVLALFVERTLEVFITAWRGEETSHRVRALEEAEKSLAQNPADLALQAPVKEKAHSLAEYRCETQTIAMQTALVLGILIAAVGVRSFGTFVVVGSNNAGVESLWLNWLKGSSNVLDVLVSGGIIGGGSDAIHKMMNIVTQFLESTAKKV